MVIDNTILITDVDLFIYLQDYFKDSCDETIIICNPTIYEIYINCEFINYKVKYSFVDVGWSIEILYNNIKPLLDELSLKIKLVKYSQ